jgi:NADPH2:quinone reductase
MKAIVMRTFGPPGVMRLEEIATPVPGPGGVLIRVHAVACCATTHG